MGWKDGWPSLETRRETWVNSIEARLDWETERERESERAMLLVPRPPCFFFLDSTLWDFLGCSSGLVSGPGRGSWEMRVGERQLHSCPPHWLGSESGAKVNTWKQTIEEQLTLPAHNCQTHRYLVCRVCQADLSLAGLSWSFPHARLPTSGC